MKKYAVIVAGGAGVRMGSPMPKQFLLLHGRPLLWYTLRTFLSAYEDLEIILVLPPDQLEAGRALLGKLEGGPHRIRIVGGGPTRWHSVYNGLDLIDGGGRAGGEESVIFVHDGVRCLLTRELIYRCYEQTVRVGSAIPVIGCRDSVRLVTPVGSEAIDRDLVKLVQTPQTFLSSVLLPAYSAGYREVFTDDAMVVEASGRSVSLVEGEVNNIKITVQADMVFAEELLGREKLG